MGTSNEAADTYFQTCIEDIAKDNGFVNYEITFGGNRAAVNGFVGTISEAEIVSGNRTMQLIIKKCGSNPQLRNILPIVLIYQREIYMYNNILPMFRQFEMDHGLSVTVFAPKFYKSVINDETCALILENLKQDGFALHDQKSQLDEHHAKLPIARLARLHAISLALREKFPSKFSTITAPLDDLLFRCLKQSGALESFVNQLEMASGSLDPHQDEDALQVFRAHIPQLESYFAELPNMVDEYSVILHGDCWKNNLLFKYSDNASIPTDVRFVDYQISKLGSPMLDFVNFFYACCTKNVIDHVEDYLKLYYDSLSDNLQQLDCSSEKLYPYSVMKEHFRKVARFGLVLRICSIMVALSDESQRKNFEAILESGDSVAKMLMYDISDTDTLNDLNRHTILHFVNNNLI